MCALPRGWTHELQKIVVRWRAARVSYIHISWFHQFLYHYYVSVTSDKFTKNLPKFENLKNLEHFAQNLKIRKNSNIFSLKKKSQIFENRKNFFSRNFIFFSLRKVFSQYFEDKLFWPLLHIYFSLLCFYYNPFHTKLPTYGHQTSNMQTWIIKIDKMTPTTY